MKKYLVRLANETANALIKDTLAQDEPSSAIWRPAGRAAGHIHIFRAADRADTYPEHSASTNTRVRAVSDAVHASIEEFALLFKLDANRAAADHTLVFNADLLQHATLYPLVAPSGSQPRRYVGVKWALVAAPSRLFRPRDFCYVECQKEFRDARGRRGWVRSLHSLRLPSVPSLEKARGVVRAALYRSGLTAVETDTPGVLSVTYTMELDLKGRADLLQLQPHFLTQRVAALATVDKLLQQQRLSSGPLLGDLDLPANPRGRGSCELCFRPLVRLGHGLRAALSARPKRFVCRKCGQDVCGRCSDDWELDVPVVGRTKLRICTVCSAEAKHSHTVRADRPRGWNANVVDGGVRADEEVEGVTHPGLVSQSQVYTRGRRRSLSMTDHPGDARAFFEQQDEIQRDLELRATELSRRVQLWDEMQLYNQEGDRRSTDPFGPRGPVDTDAAQNRGRSVAQNYGRGRNADATAAAECGRQGPQFEEEEKEMEFVDAPRSSSVQMEDLPPSTDRYPSFLSSDVPSDSLVASDAPDDESEEPEEDLNRLTAEAGARLSFDYRDSDLSDYEEHTIDDLGEIRTTTDLTRWWRDQQRASLAGQPPPLRPLPQPSLSPVASPRGPAATTTATATATNATATTTTATATTTERPSLMAERNSKQEMVDLFHHWKQESSNEQKAQEALAFEEQARYEQEQARRRQEPKAESLSSSGLPNASVLQQIQQRQKELERLQRQRQQPRDDEPPSSNSSRQELELSRQTSLAAKERYLQQQRQQQLDLAAQRRKEKRLRERKALDQTAGEGVEVMETSHGEWVPSYEAREAPIDVERDLLDLALEEEAREERKQAGAVLFDGKWISS
ncbi:hypothetical protein BBJ28_00024654 [Nothophytophthora sp. Chile5]|nr:hypothetical protein BBJ28_00024654 [Nothophytophthora sp. Chile5]